MFLQLQSHCLADAGPGLLSRPWQMTCPESHGRLPSEPDKSRPTLSWVPSVFSKLSGRMGRSQQPQRGMVASSLGSPCVHLRAPSPQGLGTGKQVSDTAPPPAPRLRAAGRGHDRGSAHQCPRLTLTQIDQNVHAMSRCGSTLALRAGTQKPRGKTRPAHETLAVTQARTGFFFSCLAKT